MKVDYPQTIDILSRFIYTINIIQDRSVLIVYIGEGEQLLWEAAGGYA